VAEVEQLARHAAREAIDAGDPVANLDDRPNIGLFGFAFEPADLRLDDVGDLGAGRGHRILLLCPGEAGRSRTVRRCETEHDHL